ncbi:MAG: NigD-like N-terminal domain-containing protein [Prevotella sp.]|nr:NigD-like N-terminal domain-containing protein [Prevotella sp.]
MKNLASQLLPFFPYLSVLLLLSCTQDLYEKGDGKYSYLRADFAEAYVNADKQVNRLVTDDNDELTLTKPYTADWIERADTTYRTAIYYNKLEKGAEALSISRVTTLTLRSDSGALSKWAPDPVGMEAAWIGRNCRYLNMGLVLKVGAADKDATPQSVGMLHGGITINADSTRTINLLFNHRQGDVPEYYSQRFYMSMPLSGLDADSVRLTIVTYDGRFVRTFPLESGL